MLKVKGVSKTFGDIVALEDVSFEADKGEIVFIVGPSGAGKTTLLNLIVGKYFPDKGQIVFNGTDVTQLTEKDLPELRQKIGFVFQDFKVLPERTLRENIEVGLAVVGVDQSEWQARVDQVLKLVDLMDRAELFPSQLSGGELQRASLARALVVNPDLILADEPTGNLDWETADEIMDLLEKINKEGKTIIMATHHKLIVEKYSDGKLKGKIIHLGKGKKKETKEEKPEKEEVKEEKKEEEKEEKKEKKEKKKRPKVKVEEVKEEEDKE